MEKQRFNANNSVNENVNIILDNNDDKDDDDKDEKDQNRQQQQHQQSLTANQLLLNNHEHRRRSNRHSHSNSQYQKQFSLTANSSKKIMMNNMKISNNTIENYHQNSFPITINQDEMINEAASNEQKQLPFNLFQQSQQQSSSSSSANNNNNHHSPSWKDALQMPSLPDYFTSVPMPSMPNIMMPNLPSMPTITMPSMPNLSMPNITMPSMPNINFPSFSDFMPFYLGKNIKSWRQICSSVREARKKYTSICPSLPSDFNFGYDDKGEKIRIYFLATINSSETTLHYCDVELNKNQANQISNTNYYNTQSNETTFPIDIDPLPEQTLQQSELESIQTSTKNEFRSSPETKNDYINDCEDLDIDTHSNSGSSESMTLSTQSLSSSSPSTSSSSPKSEESYMNTSLLRKSIASPTSSDSDLETIEWKSLIVNLDELLNIESYSHHQINYQTNKSEGSTTTFSLEEDLLLQRKRILSNGISSYSFHSKTARFVFTMNNAIFWFDDVSLNYDANQTINRYDSLGEEKMKNENLIAQNPLLPPYTPKKLINNNHTKLNASICPYQPDLVAYTADNDLWVCDLISGSEIRLTNTNYTKTAIMAGTPSFVMQEEFSRYIGFWWRPSSQNFQNVYTILCEFVDESNVEPVTISGWGTKDEKHRFPKPGSTNAKSILKLIHFAFINPLQQSTGNRHLRLLKCENLNVKFETIFPQYEYLIRCDWLNDDVIWVQLLNRQQNHLAIVVHSITEKFSSQIIYTETHQNHWYNCHKILYFFKEKTDSSNKNEKILKNDADMVSIPNDYGADLKAGSRLEFLWSSELSGFRHLYRIIVEIADFSDEKVGIKMDTTNASEESIERKGKLIENRQLTNGNWEVSESMVWIDEKNDLIYFMGTKDSALENHLYVISSSTQSTRVMPKRLSKEDFTHTRIVFDPNFEYCIDFLSNVSIPPFGYLHKVIMPSDNRLNIHLEPHFIFLNLPDDVRIGDSVEYYEKVQILGPTPQLFECKLSSGELIHGFFFKPESMEPGFKYPVLLEIYGGPEVQLVTKSFKDLRNHKRHLIASEGYIVVGFDSRGSKHRGVDFEKHIYKRLGQVEIDDQVEALKWLAENTGFIDMNRVAIHGWSYGGYLSLMALVKRPDIFKCAIAGAPVTNWLLYDTGYTERYMGLPSDNADNYRRSSILSYVKHFPNEYNRLLIIHGLMDENVHFCHTAQLIQALVMAGKPYQLSIYPCERHSPKKVNSAEHWEATMIHFLQQNL